MRYFLTSVACLALFSNNVFADSSIITLQSPYSVKLTADRLEQTLKDGGMTVFARIDHSAGAKKAGLKLRPTELVIFGNPKVGTPLMKCAQTAAIDLPQKMLVWQDKEGLVWLSWNDPAYIAKRHAVSDCNIVIDKITNALDRFAKAVIAP